MKLKNVKMGLFSCAFLFFLYSCEVEQVEPAKPTDKENAIDSAQKEKEVTDSNSLAKKDPNIEFIGTGSGQLTIKDMKNKKYSIQPGTYSGITLENLQNVSIDGTGKVIIKNGIVNITNVNDLALMGISIEDINQTAININESANNLTLKNINFRNILNWVIRFRINKKYTGSPDSYSQNIHLDNIKADNIGSLFISEGGILNDGFTGLIKGFKLTNSTIVNSPTLTNGVYLSLGENYEISNNIVNNVNSENNDHNGIFHLIGNGKVYNNKVSNHQGNAVRAWLISIEKNNALVEIYNNKVYNSTRYGAFELQVTPTIESFNVFKPANAKIYNNTAGKLNTGTPKFFEGRLLDLYTTHGTLEIYNNLLFNNRDEHVINNMAGSGTRIIRNENNRYYKNTEDAVYDTKDLESKIPNTGALK